MRPGQHRGMTPTKRRLRKLGLTVTWRNGSGAPRLGRAGMKTLPGFTGYEGPRIGSEWRWRNHAGDRTGAGGGGSGQGGSPLRAPADDTETAQAGGEQTEPKEPAGMERRAHRGRDPRPGNQAEPGDRGAGWALVRNVAAVACAIPIATLAVVAALVVDSHIVAGCIITGGVVIGACVLALGWSEP